MIRAPLWFIGLLIIIAIGVGVYAYITTPLPFGLSAVIRTPAGAAAAPISASSTPGTSARAAAGQPLALGATTVAVTAIQRNQDLTTEGRSGPPGLFTVVDVQLQNSGAEPLSLTPSAFRLVDDQGRIYAVDPDATRSENVFGHRRNIFDTSVPPGGSFNTFLVFETTPNANPASLRVQLGYGELQLPR